MEHQEDRIWLEWVNRMPKILDEYMYKVNPIVSFINKSGHRLIEKEFNPNQHFNSVLEVGAGAGEHIQYVRHGFDKYYMVDINSDFPDIVRSKYKDNLNPRVVFETQDALKLSYSDQTFDRLIAMYILEHLSKPHIALKEWQRVVKKGGIISIVIPTEGGGAWNSGRYLTTRRYYKKKGLDLDYIMAREHINACYRIVALINFYFKNKKVYWFPFHLPLVNINLLYICNIINV